MTALRLAEHVAHTTDVDAMLEGMTVEQFREWQAKDAIEPIGNEATRATLSLFACMVAAALGISEANPKMFMPWIAPPKQESTTWSQIMKAAGHGGPR